MFWLFPPYSAIAFKADARSREQDEGTRPWTPEERTGLKDQVVPVMMALAGEPALQVQIGEAISLMAETDFPQEWDSLIDVRVD